MFMDPVHYTGSLNLVQSRRPWTSGLCFFLTQEHGADSKLLLICLGLYIIVMGFRRAYEWSGVYPKGLIIISGIEKVL